MSEKKASELLLESAKPFDKACVIVKKMEVKIERLEIKLKKKEERSKIKRAEKKFNLELDGIIDNFAKSIQEKNDKIESQQATILKLCDALDEANPYTNGDAKSSLDMRNEWTALSQQFRAELKGENNQQLLNKGDE